MSPNWTLHIAYKMYEIYKKMASFNAMRSLFKMGIAKPNKKCGNLSNKLEIDNEESHSMNSKVQGTLPISFGSKKTTITMKLTMRPIGLFTRDMIENGSLFCNKSARMMK